MWRFLTVITSSLVNDKCSYFAIVIDWFCFALYSAYSFPPRWIKRITDFGENVWFVKCLICKMLDLTVWKKAASLQFNYYSFVLSQDLLFWLVSCHGMERSTFAGNVSRRISRDCLLRIFRILSDRCLINVQLSKTDFRGKRNNAKSSLKA